MTAAWIVQRPNDKDEAFDTKEQAESRALVLGASCLVYRVEIEPDVRPSAYWARANAKEAS